MELPYGKKFALSGLRVFGDPCGNSPTQVDNISTERVDDTSVQICWNKAENAIGYNIRYGIALDKLYLSHMVYDSERVVLTTLNKGQKYFYIESMGKKATFGNNITLTPDECRMLKDYAISSFAEKAEKVKYQQKYEQEKKRASVWKQRFESLDKQYQELKQKVQPYLDALEIASEKVKDFLSNILARGNDTQEHTPHRNKNRNREDAR